MTRLRRKGNASPATLYDNLNAYITIAGNIKPRPGTVVDINLPEGTKGLVSHDGQLHVFSHEPTEISDSRYNVITLRHPLDLTIPLRDIHFAAPFMGFLYVCASFEDGTQRHYWVEEFDAWEAEKTYDIGERIYPSTPNGFAYKATRIGSPNPAWAAGVERAVTDVIEPTIENGFEYVCIAVTGSVPASGSTEPDWPEAEGETVTEETLGAGGPADNPVDPAPRAPDLPPRYDNPGGSRPLLRTIR